LSGATAGFITRFVKDFRGEAALAPAQPPGFTVDNGFIESSETAGQARGEVAARLSIVLAASAVWCWYGWGGISERRLRQRRSGI